MRHNRPNFLAPGILRAAQSAMTVFGDACMTAATCSGVSSGRSADGCSRRRAGAVTRAPRSGPAVDAVTKRSPSSSPAMGGEAGRRGMFAGASGSASRTHVSTCCSPERARWIRTHTHPVGSAVGEASKSSKVGGTSASTPATLGDDPRSTSLGSPLGIHTAAARVEPLTLRIYVVGASWPQGF